MSEHADQLVLEYLSRANDVAYRHLGSAQRLDFMVRLRKRIEEYRTDAGGATEPDQVRKVLARFGDPEALVLRERRRLDGSEDKKPSQTKATGGRGAGNAKEQDGSGGGIELDELFRAKPVEVGAIGLLGFGGLLLPVPLWIFGAVAALRSRTWSAQDKWLGLLVPPLTAVALVVTGSGAGALGDGLRTGDAPLAVRLAGPAGAIYLGWVLLRVTGAKAVRVTRARGPQ